MRPKVPAGFVLPVVLLLLTLATLPLIDMASAGAQASALVSRELLRLGTFEAAEAGLLDGTAELARPIPRARLQRRHARNEVTVNMLLEATDSLPAGLSANLARIEHYRLVSRAEGARRASIELTAGMERLVPRGAP